MTDIPAITGPFDVSTIISVLNMLIIEINKIVDAGGGGGGGTPGGSSGALQYNEGGSFGGDNNITTDGNGNLSVERLTSANTIVGSISGNAATVTTNANLTGDVTSVGNAATIKSSVALAGSPTTTTQSPGTNNSTVSTTSYTDTAVAAALSAVNPAAAVEAATTANVAGYTYNNGASGIGATLTENSAAVVVIDGYTVLLNDRVLFKNQSTAANNGVYVLTTLGTGIIPAVFTRASDYNSPSNINNTGAIPVVNGTVNALSSWLLTSKVTTVGTDSITYTKFSANPTTTQPGIQFQNAGSNIGTSGGETVVNFSTGLTATESGGAVTVVSSGFGGDSLDTLFFGDGSDGNVTVSSGTTTLTRDMYYNNLTISGTGSISTVNWTIFVMGVLDLSSAPSGAIVAATGAGGAGLFDGTSGLGGTISGTGALSRLGGPALAGNNGGAGAVAGGAQGGNVLVATGRGGEGGQNTSASGKGGNGSSTTGGTAGTTAAITDQKIKSATTILSVPNGAAFARGAGGAGGSGAGGGAGDATNKGGGGGGGGAGGATLAIYAKTVNRSGATGSSAIKAIGGLGGNGGTSVAGITGGGGGGNSGGGGWIYFLFKNLTGSTATSFLDASGGVGGNAGNGNTTGTGGNGGMGGNGGRLTIINISADTITDTLGSTGTVGNTASGVTGGSGGAGGLSIANI